MQTAMPAEAVSIEQRELSGGMAGSVNTSSLKDAEGDVMQEAAHDIKRELEKKNKKID